VDNKRPDPDELLKHVEREERKRSRGKLKLFLGYSAGVGKTYAMLEDAHRCKDRGMDVIVALVEAHGRKETEALLEGLKVIPPKKVEHRGMELMEPDLDAVAGGLLSLSVGANAVGLGDGIDEEALGDALGVLFLQLSIDAVELGVLHGRDALDADLGDVVTDVFAVPVAIAALELHFNEICHFIIPDKMRLDGAGPRPSFECIL
jgi:hypothetical protein